MQSNKYLNKQDTDDKSVLTLSSMRERRNDTTKFRIDFIKNLMQGKELQPIVNFDSTATEEYTGKSYDDDESGDSYDTRIVLKKRTHDINKIISQIGGKLKYIKSGTTGHTFKGTAVDDYGEFDYGVKVVAYPRRDKYGSINNTKRPENAEIMMIKLLSYFVVKKQTPHIVLPIGTFNTSIKRFVNLIEEDVVSSSNEKYNEFVQKYKKNEYHDEVSILISEWANRGDLLDYIRNNYKNFSAMHWKVFFFQILSVLAVIQSKYPSFRHNDLKANNVLIQKISRDRQYMNYKVDGVAYRIPNIGYQVKLWDFDFACIPGIVDNIKVESKWTKDINVTPEQNRYYDVHYFLIL